MDLVVAGEQNAPNLACWQTLSTAEQAFVAAYVDNGYSLQETAEALGQSTLVLRKMLAVQNVRKAIAEVQETMDGIDFLNEKWVKAQLLRLFPMVMGEEPIPATDSAGEEVYVRKFFPEVAMKVIEYVAPKASKTPAVSININNLGTLSDKQLEEIASRGKVVSEQ